MKTFIALISLLAFTACKKSKIESVNTANSTDSSYQPKSIGSQWSYRRTVANVQNTTYKVIRLSSDTLAHGKTFNVFSSDDNSTDGVNQYIRRENDKYYSILTASTNKPELLILDAAKNVGESWLGGVNGTNTYTFTMQEKIPVFQLDGFTFKNVLVVHLEKTGPNPASVDTYFAQGIGQVKSEGTITGGGITVSVKVKVLTVDIK